MAVAAKDGSMHHSAGRASLHDKLSSGAEKKQNVAPMSKPEGQHEGAGKTPPQISNHPHMAGPHQTPTEMPIQDHVEEHGPATHVMHAEHEGTHHVTSHHGAMGENMHHSEHESHQAAHEHMGTAMGAESSSEQSPDDVNENPAEGESTKGSATAIPGLV